MPEKKKKSCSGSAYTMRCVSACVKRWYVVAERPNDRAGFLVRGLPQRTATLS